MRPAPAAEVPEYCRRDSHLTLEGFCEVTLVGEAGFQGELGQGHVREGEPLAGEFHAQPADVFTYRTALALSERAAEVVGG
jgi:hypothetical protein